MNHVIIVKDLTTIEEDQDHAAGTEVNPDQKHDPEVKEDVLNVEVTTTTLKIAHDHHHKQQDIKEVTANKEDTEIMWNHTIKINHVENNG